MSVRFVIGIAGGSGSGKSTLVQRIATGAQRDAVAVLAHDAYYHGVDRMPSSLHELGNWDHPDALDNALFVEHVRRLRAGESVPQPIYDFATSTRTTRSVLVEPRPVLVLEGILVAAVDGIRAQCDLLVWVETPADERIVRRILRDTSERGRDLSGIVAQYRRSARPSHDEHIEPSKRHAHLIVPMDTHHEPGPAVAVLEATIASVAQRRAT